MEELEFEFEQETQQGFIRRNIVGFVSNTMSLIAVFGLIVMFGG